MDASQSEARTVVCFGDSNTWGYRPGAGTRWPADVRWTGVLAHELGATWRVVEAGLNGRTTVFEDPLGDKCGKRHLGPVLESAAPVDVVIVLLGVNDLKTRFGASAYEIAEGAGVIVDAIRAGAFGPHGSAPQVLLVAPPPLATLSGWEERDAEAFAGFATMWRDAERTSRDFGRQFARVAGVRDVGFLDAAEHVTTSDVDGVHWDAEAHEAFGRAVAARVG
ncbi:MAG: SGNH/GDSL hydrolase family protein [Trueperaceae bacterium]|nr:SGNH/GDSL hydrolase family protein [Trueperaceae bacterium]